MIQLFVGILIGLASSYLLYKAFGPTLNFSETIDELVEEIENGTTFKEVENKNKKGSSDSSYWLLSNGEDKYLFTNEQLKTAKNRALKNPEDI